MALPSSLSRREERQNEKVVVLGEEELLLEEVPPFPAGGPPAAVVDDNNSNKRRRQGLLLTAGDEREEEERARRARGGRPRDDIWEHFIKTDKMRNKTVHWAVCKHCLRAHQDAPDEVPEQPLISGRKEVMINHLKTCQFAKRMPLEQHGCRSGQQQEKEEQGRNSVAIHHAKPTFWSSTSPPPAKRRCTAMSSGGDIDDCSFSSTSASSAVVASAAASSRGRKQRTLIGYVLPPYSEKQENEFHRLLLEFTADNNLPFQWIERLSTKRLFSFTNSVAADHLPTRKRLSTTILDSGAQRHDDGNKAQLMVQQARGGRVNLVTDAWENSARRHILGVLLTLFSVQWTYGALECTIRQDGLAVAESLEKLLMELGSGGWMVGAIVTDNAGQCARARRILALRWPRIVFLFCFAHQINLLVKDVLTRIFNSVAAEATAMINTLSRSTSKWLPSLRACMMKVYGVQLGIYRIADTRWNSAQSAFASLLRVKSALKIFVLTHKADPTFPKVFLPAENEDFWRHLAITEETIRPLTLASYVLQRDKCTLAEVLHVFGKIYRAFLVTGDDEIVQCVEQRWRACEQPLYMLAYILHPTFLLQAKNLPVSSEFNTIAFITETAIFYYKRLIGVEHGTLRREMFKWVQGTLTEASPHEFNTYDEFWEYLKAAGCNYIGSLALVVLSITINSATCERLFSEWGHIHTAKRNRMDAQKTKKLGIVRAAVRELDRRETNAPALSSGTAPTSSKGRLRKDPQPAERIVDPTERSRLATARWGGHEDHEELLDGSAATVRPLRGAAGVEEEEEEECEDDRGQNPLTTLIDEANAPLANESNDESSVTAATTMFKTWADVIAQQADISGENSYNDQDEEDPKQGERRQEDGEEQVEEKGHIDEDEYIRPPFPDFNDPKFPQEGKLTGHRGRKITLAALFGDAVPLTDDF